MASTETDNIAASKWPQILFGIAILAALLVAAAIVLPLVLG